MALSPQRRRSSARLLEACTKTENPVRGPRLPKEEHKESTLLKRDQTFTRPDYDCVHESQEDVQVNDGHVAEDGVLDHDGDPGCVEDGEVQGASVRQQGLGFRGWVVTKTTFPNVWGPCKRYVSVV